VACYGERMRNQPKAAASEKRTGGTMGRSLAPKKNGILTRLERVKLMAESGCDERTIRRWERNEPLTAASNERLKKAARKLGIVIPEGRA
jgi:hypothetical protein